MAARFSHTLTGGKAGFPALMTALEAHLEASGAPPAAVNAVMIAIDELVTRVLGHGGARRVTVNADVADGRIGLEIEDDGVAFDPLAADTPDTTASVDARKVGGLGIHLVRTMMDEVAYARRDDLNLFRFSKTYDEASASRGAAG